MISLYVSGSLVDLSPNQFPSINYSLLGSSPSSFTSLYSSSLELPLTNNNRLIFSSPTLSYQLFSDGSLVDEGALIVNSISDVISVHLFSSIVDITSLLSSVSTFSEISPDNDFTFSLTPSSIVSHTSYLSLQSLSGSDSSPFLRFVPLSLGYYSDFDSSHVQTLGEDEIREIPLSTNFQVSQINSDSQTSLSYVQFPFSKLTPLLNLHYLFSCLNQRVSNHLTLSPVVEDFLTNHWVSIPSIKPSALSTSYSVVSLPQDLSLGSSLILDPQLSEADFSYYPYSTFSYFSCIHVQIGSLEYDIAPNYLSQLPKNTFIPLARRYENRVSLTPGDYTVQVSTRVYNASGTLLNEVPGVFSCEEAFRHIGSSKNLNVISFSSSTDEASLFSLFQQFKDPWKVFLDVLKLYNFRFEYDSLTRTEITTFGEYYDTPIELSDAESLSEKPYVYDAKNLQFSLPRYATAFDTKFQEDNPLSYGSSSIITSYPSSSKPWFSFSSLKVPSFQPFKSNDNTLPIDEVSLPQSVDNSWNIIDYSYGIFTFSFNGNTSYPVLVYFDSDPSDKNCYFDNSILPQSITFNYISRLSARRNPSSSFGANLAFYSGEPDYATDSHLELSTVFSDVVDSASSTLLTVQLPLVQFLSRNSITIQNFVYKVLWYKNSYYVVYDLKASMDPSQLSQVTLLKVQDLENYIPSNISERYSNL